MSTATRAEIRDRIASGHPIGEQPMYRGVLVLFFEAVLGPDDGRPLSEEAKLAVLEVLKRERDRLVAEAGFASVAEMEAAQ